MSPRCIPFWKTGRGWLFACAWVYRQLLGQEGISCSNQARLGPQPFAWYWPRRAPRGFGPGLPRPIRLCSTGELKGQRISLSAAPTHQHDHQRGIGLRASDLGGCAPRSMPPAPIEAIEALIQLATPISLRCPPGHPADGAHLRPAHAASLAGYAQRNGREKDRVGTCSAGDPYYLPQLETPRCRCSEEDPWMAAAMLFADSGD